MLLTGSAPFHEVLRFLQAKAGELAHDLDDFDLLRTHGGENDVELRLLLDCRCGSAARAGHGGKRHGGRRGDAELVFEGFDELGHLDQRETLDGLHRGLRIRTGQLDCFRHGSLLLQCGTEQRGSASP
jgi:hypothetical protein